MKVLLLICCIAYICLNIEAFQTLKSINYTNKAMIKKQIQMTQSSEFLLAVVRPVYEQAKVVPYEPGGIPSWVPPVFISLIIGTIILPQIARKFQLKKNTRTIDDLIDEIDNRPPQ